MKNKIYYNDSLAQLKQLETHIVDTIFTSPPYYGQRDYGFKHQVGLEKTPTEYINRLIEIFKECYRVLKPTGNLFINIGDTYVSSGGVSYKKTQNTGTQYNIYGFQPPQRQRANWEHWMTEKQLMLIPSRLAIAMQENQWILRNDIIWAKGIRINEENTTLGNPLPSSVRDRLNNTHEHIYHFVKQKKYYYDINLIKVLSKDKQTLKNGGDVFYQPTKPSSYKHIASYPKELIKPFILATTPPNGIVMDIFAGSGTTLEVAAELGFNYIGIEGNKEYVEIIKKRLNKKGFNS